MRLTNNSKHDWFLYSDRPIPSEWSSSGSVRQCRAQNKILSLGRSQLTFTHWANMDKLDVFWSPRHHLPLLLDESIQTVLTIHDLVWKKFPETMRPSNLMVERLLMKTSTKRADRIIAVSHSTCADLVQVLGVDRSKVDVIHEAAVSPLTSSPEREFKQDYFIFVGTSEPRKNLDRLLKAHSLYRERGGVLDLVVVGDSGWGKRNLFPTTATHLGYIDDRRLDGLIHHSYALVLPSLYEGFGLPLLEAIDRGVPVIASDTSAMPEIVGSAGYLVDPKSTESIVSGLVEMSDPLVRRSFADHCMPQAAKFSWDIAAQQTLNVLESVVA